MSGFLINPHLSAPVYQTDAAIFDGTDYLNETSATDFTGNASSKKGIISFWVKPRSDNDGWNFCYVANVQFELRREATTEYIRFIGYSSEVEMITSDAIQVAGGWHHILIAHNTTTGSQQNDFYINDSAATLTTDVNTADATVDYASTSQAFMHDNGAGRKVNAEIADFYYNTAEYLDMTVEANRRKFIDASGGPVDLGSDGSTPTGTKPVLFMHLDVGETASEFATNRTGNGDMTITGALTTGDTLPDDM